MRLFPLPGTLLLALLFATALGLASRHDTKDSVVSAATAQPSEHSSELVEGLPIPTQSLQYMPRHKVDSIVSRPLFEPSRRPIDKVEPKRIVVTEPVKAAPVQTVIVTVLEPPPPPPIPEFRLHGVMLLGAQSTALISKDGGEPEWINKKELVFNWVLSDIAANTITLEQTGRRISVPLYPN